MESRNITTKYFVLKLNEDEASWLRGVMQNPIHSDDPVEEDSYDKEMRSKFFEAVKQSGRGGSVNIPDSLKGL